jgi:hypothetical protein
MGPVAAFRRPISIRNESPEFLRATFAIGKLSGYAAIHQGVGITPKAIFENLLNVGFVPISMVRRANDRLFLGVGVLF